MLGMLRRIVPRFIRRNYALKFAIALVVLGVSVGGVGIAATDQMSEQIQADANEEYATLAEQEARALYAWNQQQRQVVESVARGTPTGDSTENITKYLEREKKGFTGSDAGDSANLHYIDRSTGEVVASTKFGLAGTPVSELNGSWTEELSGGTETVMTGAYSSESTYGSNVPRYAFVTTKDLPADMALVYAVPLQEYVGNLQGSDGSGTTLVVDRSGSVVFEETGSHLLSTYGEDTSAVQNGLGLDPGESGALQGGPPTGAVLTDGTASGVNGTSYVVGYSPVAKTDWVVLVHTPTTEAYGFVESVSQYGLYATVAGVVLIGLVGAVLGRNTAKSVDRLRSKAEQMENGNLNVEFETGRIDNIGRLYDGFAEMRDALRDQISEARDARDAAETAQARAERMNTHLERKADEYSTVMAACADGDLTARMDPESQNEAMADIAAAFNEMVAEIEATTAEVKTFAQEVATASEEVTASSEEVRGASEQVTESIQEISDGADRQNEEFQAVSHEMESLSTTTEEIAASSNEVADLAERTAETGRDGREAAQAAKSGMNDIESQSAAAVSDIADLADEMDEIDELAEFISSLAKETNMLALNANIEASRGGEESGDGFAVVARQVKELAADTKEAAEDIDSRLDRIQAQTSQTVEGVEATRRQIVETTEAVDNAVDALDEIAGYATETNTGIQEISAATEEQAASTEEVVAMVDEAATISEETTAEAENVAAAAEEQTTALTEVSASASSLSEQASRLSEALDRFDTEVPDVADGGVSSSSPDDTDEFVFGDTDDAELVDELEPDPSDD
ncbi:methyl-accepting chemotaxis protein [Haloarchaeobius sp. HME9146]|uniref:methyl-accepting chemotaxis protein n=1 Tax=Haloarchaeobius sp. HME9146 TaxID=2978732 RepID=UPI0021BF1652|nr:methyl-accepting chemotaxis protein [Haloarchaeobius sp. HME9146]MCT9096137.1 methyl-accepting chemotaxis protein [Haloarchaeobius sp. HME9146]